jgi:hypothetical protein
MCSIFFVMHEPSFVFVLHGNLQNGQTAIDIAKSQGLYNVARIIWVRLLATMLSYFKILDEPPRVPAHQISEFDLIQHTQGHVSPNS